VSNKTRNVFLKLLPIYNYLAILWWLFFAAAAYRADTSPGERIFPIMIAAAIIVGLSLTLVYCFVWHNWFLRVLSHIANVCFGIAGLCLLFGVLWEESIVALWNVFVILYFIFLFIPAFLFFGSQYFPSKKQGG